MKLFFVADGLSAFAFARICVLEKLQLRFMEPFLSHHCIARCTDCNSAIIYDLIFNKIAYLVT